MDLFSYLLGKKSSGGGGSADLSDYFTSTINYEGFEAMVKKIPDTTTVEGTDLHGAFTGYKGTAIPLLDTSNVTVMNSMFNGCTNLITIPLLNTSKVNNMSSMFNNCSSLISIPSIDTSSVISGNMNNMFGGCSSLETVPVLNTTNITNMNDMFSGCTSLSDTSLDNILQMCINSKVSVQTRKKLTSIGILSTNYPASKIEALPHYQDFINAGWTIGY